MITTIENTTIKNRKKIKRIDFYYEAEYKKHIGTLFITKNSRAYYKKVNSQKHRLHLFDAYGIQKEVFDKYLKGKNGSIIIDEDDTGARLKSDIKTWQKHGVYRNYGEEQQIFLSVKYMNIFKPLNYL